MGEVDVTEVSPELFITGIIFIMLIGSFLSLGVLRFFQLRKKQGGMFMGLSALSFVLLIVVTNVWF
ncbi:hypothetical protein [Cohnella cholangitidis]|uniref:Uncharacterized protein n=1 Tax=Cohnella cholangitidis TaxID=2598458 RepID=A0A7G5C4T8_9BACL|nr:hypothetical protein [Cohnella cholangitidis]QMV44222.1 hypothetical protein FPL14_25925 [Cohnella cholangitidis]